MVQGFIDFIFHSFSYNEFQFIIRLESDWWDGEIAELVKEKKDAHKKWLASQNMDD